MIRFALKVVIMAVAFYGLTRLLTGIDVVGNEDAPLGITGTAALELKLSGKRRALATMCVGVGQGISIALEAV